MQHAPPGFKRFVTRKTKQTRGAQDEDSQTHMLWRLLSSTQCESSESDASDTHPIVGWANFYACLMMGHVSLDRMCVRIDAFLRTVRPSAETRAYIVANLLEHPTLDSDIRSTCLRKLVHGQLERAPALPRIPDLASIYSLSTHKNGPVLQYRLNDETVVHSFELPLDQLEFVCDSNYPPAGHWKGRLGCFRLLYNIAHKTVIIMSDGTLAVIAPDQLCAFVKHNFV